MTRILHLHRRRLGNRPPLPLSVEHPRGVFFAPWKGPAGEPVLFARATDDRIVGRPVVVADGDILRASTGLWDLLDRVDPEPAS